VIKAREQEERTIKLRGFGWAKVLSFELSPGAFGFGSGYGEAVN